MAMIPEPKVCARYGVTPMSLWRWRREPRLNFPQPTVIRRRKYTPEEELDAFDAAQRAKDEKIVCCPRPAPVELASKPKLVTRRNEEAAS